MKISATIVTLNEERNIARAIRSLGCADEIIVVDSGSTDRTCAIARELGACVVEEPWRGYAAQKNFAANCAAYDWILSLDADEELTHELQFEMQNLLMSKPTADAYFLKRRNLFLGRWIKHGGFYPDPKLRLFRRAAANFVRTPQFEERPVHETIVFNGISATLNYDLIHHAYPTLSTYIEHMDRYSSLGAELLIAKGRTSQNILSFLFNVWLIPQLTFTWNYIFRLGFLDGREGLLLHLYHAIYTSWKYGKAWERSRKR
jgi:glycosyltransferase involved in cell wall biosynthesis